MKIEPNLKSRDKREEDSKKIEAITYKIAIAIAAISVYYFFIKIVFL